MCGSVHIREASNVPEGTYGTRGHGFRPVSGNAEILEHAPFEEQESPRALNGGMREGRRSPGLGGRRGPGRPTEGRRQGVRVRPQGLVPGRDGRATGGGGILGNLRPGFANHSCALESRVDWGQ